MLTYNYCSIGSTNNNRDLYLLEYNLNRLSEVLKHPYSFNIKEVIVADNGIKSKEAFELWRDKISYNTKCLFLDSNRGHTFGTMELDNTVLSNSKNSDFTIKSTNDMLTGKNLVKKLDEITHSYDFYYLDSVGYANVFSYDRQNFSPQTNFYIIKTSILEKNGPVNRPELYNKVYLNYINNNPNELKPWEFEPKVECESELLSYVKKYNLKSCPLLGDNTLKNLLSIVKDLNIHDCSHKNLYLQEIGLTHFHPSTEPIYHI